MTLTAKTYGDGRGMITSAWLPTKWFVIASAILNSNTTVITLIVTPCVHWRVQNNILKTGTLSIVADVCAKWVVVITLVVPLRPDYFITSCVPGVEARAACPLLTKHTHCRLTNQARFLLLFSSSLALVSAAGIPGLLQCVADGISTSVKEGNAALHSDYCLLCTHLSVDQVTTTSKKSSAARCHKLLSKKLDRIKWLQHKIGCNNIHIPVLPDDWCSINISIHLNILVPSLHP